MVIVLCTCYAMTVTTTPGTVCTFSDANEDVVNAFTIGTIVLGVISIVLCLGVVLVIVAYSKDKAYLRERIIFGLMLSNIAFSVTNIVPVQLIEHDCTNVITIIPKAWTRGVWFFGKYWMVSLHCSGFDWHLLVLNISHQ